MFWEQPGRLLIKLSDAAAANRSTDNCGDHTIVGRERQRCGKSFETMLNKGDHVPRFEITTIDDIRVNYADLWQKKNLALVCLSEDDSAGRAVLHPAAARSAEGACGARRGGRRDDDADRGHAAAWLRRGRSLGRDAVDYVGDRVADLPSAREIAAWLRFVEIQCPECEGEVH